MKFDNQTEIILQAYNAGRDDGYSKGYMVGGTVLAIILAIIIIVKSYL